MPERIDLVRRVNRQLAGQAVGLRPEHPRIMGRQRSLAFQEADIFGLPVAEGVFQEIQVMDPTSPDFGKFYFIPDFSDPDGPDILR